MLFLRYPRHGGPIARRSQCFNADSYLVVVVYNRHGSFDKLDRFNGHAIPIRRRRGRYSDKLDAALEQADFVSIHVAANERTKHLFNAARFNAMKRGSVLINTSRGSVVDESALFDTLTAGHLSAAALDVYETEPYRPVSPEKDLRTLERVVFTPHVGSNTIEANHRMTRACLANAANFHAGKLDQLTRVDC